MASIPSRIYLISRSVFLSSLSLLLLSDSQLTPPLNRTGDILLGLSTGVFAYYLYEKKLNRTGQDTLSGLVAWKWDQRQLRNKSLGQDDAKEDTTSWEELTKEINKEEK